MADDRPPLLAFGPDEPPGREYEFSVAANLLFSDLARNMRLLAIVQLLLGLAATAYGAVTILHGGSGFLVLGLLNLPPVVFHLRSAGQFRKIATTGGKDIHHLMTALGALRNLYGYTTYLLIGGLILLFVADVYNYMTVISPGP
jgi:hypothetical protein